MRRVIQERAIVRSPDQHGLDLHSVEICQSYHSSTSAVVHALTAATSSSSTSKAASYSTTSSHKAVCHPMRPRDTFSKS